MSIQSKEYTEYVCIRTRSQNKIIGFGCALFMLIFVIITLTSSPHGGDVLAAMAVWVPVFIIAIIFTVRSFLGGSILLADDRLVYRSILRTRWISKDDLVQVDSGVRTRFPSPRRYSQPVLKFSNGGELWLVEFSVPTSSYFNDVQKTVQYGLEKERDYESQAEMLSELSQWVMSYTR